MKKYAVFALLLGAFLLPDLVRAQTAPAAPKPTNCSGAQTPEQFRYCLALTGKPKGVVHPPAGGSAGGHPRLIPPPKLN